MLVGALPRSLLPHPAAASCWSVAAPRTACSRRRRCCRCWHAIDPPRPPTRSSASPASLSATCPLLPQVRYVASHLRSLFRSSQPWRELPVIFGLPRGCYSMRCAVVFEEQVTSNRLQRFAGARLLRLPALPPLSGVLLGYW